MPFPIGPTGGQSPWEFLIQDPFGVRESILPLLTVNKQTGNLTGLGTAFCADPYGGFLTAQHIFDDIDLTKPLPAFDEIPVAMLSIGVVFGTVGLPQELFAPMATIHGFVDQKPQDPLHQMITGKTKPGMIADCLRLSFAMKDKKRAERVAPLPLRCSGTAPQPGDRLLAIGYPELGMVKDEPPLRHPVYVERMYGAIGEVVNIYPHGLTPSRPWPTIELKANWRSGMSGGPLFNEAGEIVGLVSSSIEPDETGYGVGFALWFGGFPILNLIPFLDPSNPGMYRGFGVIRNRPWHLAGMFPEKDQAAALAAQIGSDYEVLFGSWWYGTDDFMIG